MQQPIKVVAVLAANPALSSVLSAVLAATPGLRVRQFESRIALETYMRLSPVDLLVTDFDCAEAPAAELARRVRADEGVLRREFQIIALTGSVTEAVKDASLSSGIDEVIVKPMSPKYLLERVQSRLRRAALQRPAGVWPDIERRAVPRPVRLMPAGGWSDNVVPLFKDQPAPSR